MMIVMLNVIVIVRVERDRFNNLGGCFWCVFGGCFCYFNIFLLMVFI
jgi:hypothetical protein